MQRLRVLPSCTGDMLWSQNLHSSDWAPSSHHMHPSAELWAGLHCQSWHSILFLMHQITNWKQTRSLSHVLPDIIEREEFRTYSASHHLWSALLSSIFITSQWIHPLNVYLVIREDLFDLQTKDILFVSQHLCVFTLPMSIESVMTSRKPRREKTRSRCSIKF